MRVPLTVLSVRLATQVIGIDLWLIWLLARRLLVLVVPEQYGVASNWQSLLREISQYLDKEQAQFPCYFANDAGVLLVTVVDTGLCQTVNSTQLLHPDVFGAVA